MLYRFLQYLFVFDVFRCCHANIKSSYEKLQYGYRLDGKVIDSFSANSILDCVKECLRRERCQSFSYHGGGSYCEISYKSKITSSGRYKKSDGWVYSQREDWPMDLLGACSKTDCKRNEKCEEVSSTRFQCKIADCGLPEIRRARMESIGRWDGIATGREVHVKCDEGYQLLGSGLIHCQSNGQWKTDTSCGCLSLNAFNGHCYKFHTEELSWNEAKTLCEKGGGYLAEVETPAENGWMFQTFIATRFSSTAAECPDFYSCGTWIGGNDLAQEHSFVWSHSKKPIDLNNLWFTGQPSNYPGEQDCLSIVSQSGQWNDLSCSDSRPFICEFEF